MGGILSRQRKCLPLGFRLVSLHKEGRVTSGRGRANNLLLILHAVDPVFEREGELVLEGGQVLLDRLLDR